VRIVARILFGVAPLAFGTGLVLGIGRFVWPPWAAMIVASGILLPGAALLYWPPSHRLLQIMAILGGLLGIGGLIHLGLVIVNHETPERIYVYPGLMILCSCGLVTGLGGHYKVEAARKATSTKIS